MILPCSWHDIGYTEDCLSNSSLFPSSVHSYLPCGLLAMHPRSSASFTHSSPPTALRQTDGRDRYFCVFLWESCGFGGIEGEKKLDKWASFKLMSRTRVTILVCGSADTLNGPLLLLLANFYFEITVYSRWLTTRDNTHNFTKIPKKLKQPLFFLVITNINLCLLHSTVFSSLFQCLRLRNDLIVDEVPPPLLIGGVVVGRVDPLPQRQLSDRSVHLDIGVVNSIILYGVCEMSYWIQ